MPTAQSYNLDNIEEKHDDDDPSTRIVKTTSAAARDDCPHQHHPNRQVLATGATAALSSSSTDQTTTSSSSRFAAVISLRFVIGIFFTIILVLAWTLPVVVLFNNADSQIQQSVRLLGAEVAILIKETVEGQQSVGGVAFDGLNNQTEKIASEMLFALSDEHFSEPSSNITRRFFLTLLLKYTLMSVVPPSRQRHGQQEKIPLPAFLLRFIDGTMIVVMATPSSTRRFQICRSNDSFFDFDDLQQKRNNPDTVPADGNWTDCPDILIINESTYEGLDRTTYKSFYDDLEPSYERTFVNSELWNVTAFLATQYQSFGIDQGNKSVIRFPPFAGGRSDQAEGVRIEISHAAVRMTNGYYYPNLLPSTSPAFSSSSSSARVDNAFILFSSLTRFTTDLGPQLRQLLPPDARGARAYITTKLFSDPKHVVAASHSPTWRLLPVDNMYTGDNTSGDKLPLPDNCFVSISSSETGFQTFCFNTVSGYPDFYLVRGDYDRNEYIVNEQNITFLNSVAVLHIFLPIDYYLQPLQDATWATIIVIVILVLAGFGATLVSLHIILKRVEVLSVEMQKDPFERSKKIVRDRKMALLLAKQTQEEEQIIKPSSSSSSASSSPTQQISSAGNNNNTSDEIFNQNNEESFWRLSEIDSIEVAFAELSEMIQRLSSFMPARKMTKKKNSSNSKSSSSGSGSSNNINSSNPTISEHDKTDNNNNASNNENNNHAEVGSSRKSSNDDDYTDIIITNNNNNNSTGIINNSASGKHKRVRFHDQKLDVDKDTALEKTSISDEHLQPPAACVAAEEEEEQRQHKSNTITDNRTTIIDGNRIIQAADDDDGSSSIGSDFDDEYTDDSTDTIDNNSNNNKMTKNDDTKSSRYKKTVREKKKRGAEKPTFVKCLVAHLHFFGPSSSSSFFECDDGEKDNEDEKVSIITTSRRINAHRQTLLDRAELIVSTVMNDLVDPTGACLIEYRNDTFLITLRISRKTIQSRLASRFCEKLMLVADKIAASPLQKEYNVGPEKSVCMSASIVIDSYAKILQVDPSSSGGGLGNDVDDNKNNNNNNNNSTSTGAHHHYQQVARPVTVLSNWIGLGSAFEVANRRVLEALPTTVRSSGETTKRVKIIKPGGNNNNSSSSSLHFSYKNKSRNPSSHHILPRNESASSSSSTIAIPKSHLSLLVGVMSKDEFTLRREVQEMVGSDDTNNNNVRSAPSSLRAVAAARPPRHQLIMTHASFVDTFRRVIFRFADSTASCSVNRVIIDDDDEVFHGFFRDAKSSSSKNCSTNDDADADADDDDDDSANNRAKNKFEIQSADAANVAEIRNNDHPSVSFPLTASEILLLESHELQLLFQS